MFILCTWHGVANHFHLLDIECFYYAHDMIKKTIFVKTCTGYGF
jgi:hypothetical protein